MYFGCLAHFSCYVCMIFFINYKATAPEVIYAPRSIVKQSSRVCGETQGTEAVMKTDVMPGAKDAMRSCASPLSPPSHHLAAEYLLSCLPCKVIPPSHFVVGWKNLAVAPICLFFSCMFLLTQSHLIWHLSYGLQAGFSLAKPFEDTLVKC